MARSRSSRTKKTSTKSAISTGKTSQAPAEENKKSRVGFSFKAVARAGLKDRSSDVAGLGLVALTVICVLALFGDRAGFVGRLLEDAMSVLVGVFRFVVPAALLWCAYEIFRDREAERTWRIGFGALLSSLSISGLVHLAGDASGWGSNLDDLRASGGVVGALAAEPIRGLIDDAGAWSLLLFATAFGLLVIADIRVRQVFSWIGTGLKYLSRSVRRVAVNLQRLGSDGEVVTQARTGSNDSGAGSSEKTLDSFREPEIEIPVSLPERDEQSDWDSEDIASGEPGLRESVEANVEQVADEEVEVMPEQMTIDLAANDGETWQLPSLSLLEKSSHHEVDERLLQSGARNLEAALASHGVETRVTGMEVGPTVTRYELSLGKGVKVSRVTSLHKDIAYAMASADVRILAPIPGRSAIGIEVPNSERQLVALGDILLSRRAAEVKHPLHVALGQDISGNAVMANLAEMPHVLIAGATGAGKSSCINSIISSLLVRSTPDEVKMILIDPKRVELGQYDRLPHLLTQVVTSPKKAANALSWAVKEMERRYDVLSEIGFRDITGYNDAYDQGRLASDLNEEREFERMPFIVVVVDELNDLMMVAARDVEDSITRLAQMARAVGIHLVIATQRPSVNVITGVIKANIPSRMAFAVSSLADSRVILDQAGAERLIGKGDMLLVGASSGVAQRIQGCWVSEPEVHQLVAHWRRQSRGTSYVEGVEGSEEKKKMIPGGTSGDDSDDELMVKAMAIVVENQLGSTSMLQRKLKVGFARAGRLMDLLEQRGVVGPSIGSRARDVLMTKEELEELNSSDE